jgi:hypothetical protein
LREIFLLMFLSYFITIESDLQRDVLYTSNNKQIKKGRTKKGDYKQGYHVHSIKL